MSGLYDLLGLTYKYALDNDIQSVNQLKKFSMLINEKKYAGTKTYDYVDSLLNSLVLSVSPLMPNMRDQFLDDAQNKLLELYKKIEV